MLLRLHASDGDSERPLVHVLYPKVSVSFSPSFLLIYKVSSILDEARLVSTAPTMISLLSVHFVLHHQAFLLIPESAAHVNEGIVLPVPRLCFPGGLDLPTGTLLPHHLNHKTTRVSHPELHGVLRNKDVLRPPLPTIP